MYVVEVFRGGWSEIVDFCDTAEEATELAVSISTEGVMYVGWILYQERKILETQTFYCAVGFPESHRYGEDLVFRSCKQWLSEN